MDRRVSQTMSRKLLQALPILLLGVVALTQLYLVWNGYGFQRLKASWRTRDMPAETRGVRFMLGTRAAGYIDFLQANVPDGMKIVLPFGVGEFTQQSLLQFFLMPYPIPGCDCGSNKFEEVTRECVLCLRDENHAVPAIGPFPPLQAVQEQKEFLANPEDTGWFHGVYVPEVPVAPIQDKTELPLIAVAAIDALLVLALFLLGSLVVGAFVSAPSWDYLLPLGWPLGMGLLTFGVFLAGWAGAAIVPMTFMIMFAALAGSLLLIRYRRWGSASPFPPLRRVPSEVKGLSISRVLGLLAVAATVILVLVAIAISIGRAYSTFDGIANWAIKGYAIALEGSIFAGSDWGKHGLAYPQNVPLLITLFRVFDNDALPGSKLASPLLMGSMLAGCFVLWRRAGVSLNSAAWAALGLATIPSLFLHATIGFVNLPFTAYLVLGTLFLARGLVDDEQASSAIGSLLLGFAAWTRPEGAAFGLLILMALIAGSWLLRKRWTAKVMTVAPFVVIAGSWLAFGNRYIADDEIGQLMRAFLPAIMAGNIRAEPLVNVLTHVGDQIPAWRIWGFMLVAIPAFIGFGIARARPRNNALGYLVGMAGLVSLLFPILMFYVAGYTPGYGISWLQDSFDRAMFPAVVLLFWAGVALAFARPTPSGSDIEMSDTQARASF